MNHTQSHIVNHYEDFLQHFNNKDKIIEIDGNTLTIKGLYKLGYEDYKIKLSKTSEEKVQKARNVVENVIKDNKVVYAITTGIGKFATTTIPKENLNMLQLNIIRSHSAGVGDPLSIANTKMLFALRINVLAKGYSGITLETLEKYIDAFNRNLLPYVPEQGTVGASGDLCPLAHLALGLIGEGLMWNFKENRWSEAIDILKENDYEPIQLKTKEGIALINGTCFIAALGCEALYRAEKLAIQATIISAITLECLKGSYKAFSANIQDLRPYHGQKMIASLLRDLLISENNPSLIGISHTSCKKVQDSYTLRCIPQVHGIVIDTINFVKNILTIEINCGTDNPLVLPDTGEIISGGNFHGEYPAKALDYLAIAIHEISSISERRIERLVNTDLSHLPPFLAPDGGLNSGFMMAHVTAASLVSENKVLCHPSSVDSLSTSASKEDHVSMGGFSARKALKIVANVENVLAIELLACCQALEFLRPLKSTTPIEAVHSFVRQHIKKLDMDRPMWKDIEIARNILRRGEILDLMKPLLKSYNDFDLDYQKYLENR
ncbi:unnamed protein product [Gordionus sp. m RMFG-2023]|uniref:histidine ammonia-lyase-like n=1 Tax=Gordionus sp. m RMFG-2023 TaxID=3053472 RepID=UPI0030E0B85E